MANVRPLNKQKYCISSNRFRELYYHCLQYSEWRDELKHKTDSLNGINLEEIKTKNVSSATENLAIRRSQLMKKCELIEQTAIEADPELYQYILKAVTSEGISYNYLYTIMDMPCSRNTWYDRRRKFYFLLSEKKYKFGTHGTE